MTMVRKIIGWILLLGIIPLCAFTVIASGKEVKQIKPFDQVLDKHIDLKAINLVQNSYMYDRDGSLVSEIVSDHENRVIVPFNKIPNEVKQLFLTSEDRHFYEHKGFDFMGMVRAAASNFKDHKIDQGASTITQQLARNVYLSHERTFSRKLTELAYSYQLEKKYSKDEILEGYLNTIYFNNGVYGVGSAAQFYFSKPLKSLTLGEMAFICAIPNNPTLYDPLKHFDYTKKRQVRLLNGLKKAGVISGKQLKKAEKEKIKLDINEKTNKYPDYVSYVNDEFTQLVSSSEGYDKRLEKASGKAKQKIQSELSDRVSTLLKDGVKIYTALNPYMQNQVVAQVNQNLPYAGVQGGAAVINHQTHQIIALSGGKDYHKYDFNRAYQAYRQPVHPLSRCLITDLTLKRPAQRHTAKLTQANSAVRITARRTIITAHTARLRWKRRLNTRTTHRPSESWTASASIRRSATLNRFISRSWSARITVCLRRWAVLQTA